MSETQGFALGYYNAGLQPDCLAVSRTGLAQALTTRAFNSQP